MVGFNLLERGVHQFDDVFDVLDVRHFHGRVHVAQGQRNERGDNAPVRESEGVRVRSRGAAGGLALERNFFFFGGGNDEV